MRVSIDHIRTHIEELTEKIGPRVMGSREDQMAMDYIVGLLQELRVETRTHQIGCPCWQHRETSLTLGPSGESIPAQGCQFSASCDIVGEVVLADTMDKANNAAVHGRICMMPAGIAANVTERNIAALALEARGAMGLIVNREHTHPDAFDGKIVREPDLRRMPVACVSGRAAERILSSHPPLRLAIDASFWWGHTSNIEAVIPGTRPGRIFLTAHHDTGAGSPGATDDGVSVAILLEVARLFSEQASPCELRIVFTGAHERLGQGSQDYVRGNKELVKDASLELNFDGIGAKTGSPTALVCGPENLIERLEQVLAPRGPWELKPQEFKTFRGDAGPFADEGLPAVWLRTPPKDPMYRLGHTQLDDTAAIDLNVTHVAAQAAVEVIRSEFWKS